MNQNRRHVLSKSRISAFEQCPKKLWLQVHAPGLAERDDKAAPRFAAGNALGTIARAIYPDGIMVAAEPDLAAALQETSRLIDEGYPGPIFEATFEHEGVIVRVDVLERQDNGWHAAEVKSTTGVKDYHRGDLATQIWVMRGAGLLLSDVSLRHIDRSFVLTRVGHYVGLLSDVPMLAALEPLIADRGNVVAAAMLVLAGDEPAVAMGGHCKIPFQCEFAAYCGRDQPLEPEWSIACLPGRGRAKWIEAGYSDLLDLPEDRLTPQFAKILAATRDDIPFHDVEGATADMAAWQYPRAWLDFETIAPAVPRWLGTRPYQQVPFQFSLHLEQVDGTITHHEFLSLDGTDPREACAEALARLVPVEATIIAYFAQFERSVLRDLARDFPQYAQALLAIAERTVDLLPVAQKRWYHRDQRGSWSIKAVLPTIARDLDYATLEVKDGGKAQEAWLEAVDPACDPLRREALSEALKIYCERDTWAMVVIARALSGQG